MAPRILQVTAVDFTVAKLLAPLIHHLEAKGCEVVTACARGEHWERLQEQGFKLVEIPFERRANPLTMRKAGKALLRHLRQEKYDLVHAHTPVASISGRWAAWKAQVPVIIYTAHGFYFHENMRPWLRRAHIMLEKWAARRHHHLFTQSEEDRQTAIAEGICGPTGITTIGNGVDLTRFDTGRLTDSQRKKLREELGLKPDSPVAIHVARLVEHKGAKDIVEAAAIVREKIPNAQCLIVGSALKSDRHNFEGTIRDLIKRLGLEETVILAGARADVEDLMAISDVFVLPSAFEGVPRSGIEAMASGLPCIMSNIRGCREEIVEGETGHIVPLRDVPALADRLIRVLGNPEMRRAMGGAGRIRAMRLFDERRVLDREWRIMREMMKAKGIEVPSV